MVRGAAFLLLAALLHSACAAPRPGKEPDAPRGCAAVPSHVLGLTRPRRALRRRNSRRERRARRSLNRTAQCQPQRGADSLLQSESTEPQPDRPEPTSTWRGFSSSTAIEHSLCLFCFVLFCFVLFSPFPSFSPFRSGSRPCVSPFLLVRVVGWCKGQGVVWVCEV